MYRVHRICVGQYFTPSRFRPAACDFPFFSPPFFSFFHSHPLPTPIPPLVRRQPSNKTRTPRFSSRPVKSTPQSCPRRRSSPCRMLLSTTPPATSTWLFTTRSTTAPSSSTSTPVVRRSCSTLPVRMPPRLSRMLATVTRPERFSTASSSVSSSVCLVTRAPSAKSPTRTREAARLIPPAPA